MAAAMPRVSGDARRHPSSPGTSRTFENRPPVAAVLCRNGPQCRKHQEGTCQHNHDFSGMAANNVIGSKKSLNVASPSFTPRPGNSLPASSVATKALGISPKTATAAAFTPRGSGNVTPAAHSHSKEPSGESFSDQSFQPAHQTFQDFVPQNFVPHSQGHAGGTMSSQNFFNGDSYGPEQSQADHQNHIQTTINPYSDPFMPTQATGFEGGQTTLNPYSSTNPTVGAQSFFQDSGSYKHQLNYHLYSPMGPHRQNLQPYQRNTSDFFLPEPLREELQRKSEASLQTFANSTLPASIEHFHTLVALDIGNHRTPPTFGYPSHMYKATSNKDGKLYALRRIAGFRLSDAAAVKSVTHWKRVNSGSVVKVHDAFTTRLFGDTSLMVVTDYFPLSQNLHEKSQGVHRGGGPNRGAGQPIPEQEIWSYVVQLSQAVKAIHTQGLAARSVLLSKILVTSKNRIRLNGCGVFDIVEHGKQQSLEDLQKADLQDLGRVILALATRTWTAIYDVEKTLESVSRVYSDRLQSCLRYLLNPPQTDLLIQPRRETADSVDAFNIKNFIASISNEIADTLDSCLQSEDERTSQLTQELENGRIARLMIKLGVILERPEYSPHTGNNPAMFTQAQQSWSEVGERYYLKLFRDYVFHQVDHDGLPVMNLGHIIQCLNKLDAGVDETVQLVSRDERDVILASYKEVKRGFESAWAELIKAGATSKR